MNDDLKAEIEKTRLVWIRPENYNNGDAAAILSLLAALELAIEQRDISTRQWVSGRPLDEVIEEDNAAILARLRGEA